VPPYVFACIFTIGGSWVADRVRQRGIFLLGFQLVAILGFSLLLGSGNSTIQYIGTIFAAIGMFTLAVKKPFLILEQASTLRSRWVWHGTEATSAAA